jgi:mono/diheme cytochrome c family protein
MSRPSLMAASAALLALSAAGCGDGEKKSRGLDYMPEMYNTPAYKSQGVIVHEQGSGKATTVRQLPAMLTPPAGTVSREGATYAIEATDFAAAKALVNPLAPTTAVLKAGQRGFGIYCAACHGLDGNSANGFVVATKEHPDRFGGVPSISTVNVARLSDGEIYHIITLGRNRMPNYRAQLPPAERWAVVHYARALARATVAAGDAEAELAKAEKAAKDAGKPPTADTQANLDALRAAVAQRRLDLDLIRRGGDGHEFTPPAPPLPEYVKPTWQSEK